MVLCHRSICTNLDAEHDTPGMISQNVQQKWPPTHLQTAPIHLQTSRVHLKTAPTRLQTATPIFKLNLMYIEIQSLHVRSSRVNVSLVS